MVKKARYCLSEELKAELRKPYGILYPGDSPETAKKVAKELGNPTKLISVGDIITFNLLEAGVIPDISVVDEKTRRVPASEKVIQGTKHPRFETIIVENPAGSITEELVLAMAKALESTRPIRIFVRGEEDLAALPAIALAPITSVIIYGLPDQGAVLVKVTETKKKEIKNILERMECKEEK